MKTYHFGIDIERIFTVEINEQPFNLPNQSPSIYVFDSQPSLENAQDGTGSFQTITSWTQSAIPPYARAYTIAAIDDPDPDGSVWYRDYWVAVNFKFASSEQTQTKVEAFRVQRSISVSDPIEIGKGDLTAIFPNIESYISDDDLEALLPVCLSQVRRDLKKKGKEWGQFRNHSELKMAVCYKAIALQALVSIREPDDRHAFRFDQFEKWYQAEMASLYLDYDADNDGLAETKEQAKTQTVFLYR